MRVFLLTNFWDVIAWFVEALIFIAYLFALFWIIGDLMRDRKLNGWLKAIWILFLVFVPFVTALVYLIARGRGMADRQSAHVQESRAQTEEYLRSLTGARPSDEIAKAKALLDAGTITPTEFEALKAKALSALS